MSSRRASRPRWASACRAAWSKAINAWRGCCKMSTNTGTTDFTISGEFALAPEQMFELWTDCAHLSKWFGPKGSEMLNCENDLREGGMLLYELKHSQQIGGGVA